VVVVVEEVDEEIGADVDVLDVLEELDVVVGAGSSAFTA
jgi:hypothetical protein